MFVFIFGSRKIDYRNFVLIFFANMQTYFFASFKSFANIFQYKQ